MDEQRLRKRFAELTELSRRQNIYHYTEFLTPAEAADARAMTPEKEYCAFGGAADCERVIVRFGEPAQIGYEEPFPVSVQNDRCVFENAGTDQGTSRGIRFEVRNRKRPESQGGEVEYSPAGRLVFRPEHADR